MHQFNEKMLPEIFIGCVLRAGEGWTGDLLLADFEDLENLRASETDDKKFTHEEGSQEGALSLPCTDGSFSTTVAKGPLRDSSSKMEKEVEETSFDKAKLFFWSVSGDTISRHHAKYIDQLFLLRPK